MNHDEVMVTPEQMRDAETALDIAAFNGLLEIAIILKKRGLITPAELSSMHEGMTKPLSLPVNAKNPLIQGAHQNLDVLFATLLEPR